MDIFDSIRELTNAYGIGGALLLIAIVYLARSIPVIYRQWLEIQTVGVKTEQVKVEASADDQREENKQVNMLIQLVAENQRTTNTILNGFRTDISEGHKVNTKLAGGFDNMALELKATRLSFETWPDKVNTSITQLATNFAEAIEELSTLRVQIEVDHHEIAEKLGHIMAKLEGPQFKPPEVGTSEPPEDDLSSATDPDRASQVVKPTDEPDFDAGDSARNEQSIQRQTLAELPLKP